MKIAFCKMCTTICGRFLLNKGGVAGYVDRIYYKSTNFNQLEALTAESVQIVGMNFQTGSKDQLVTKTPQIPDY